MVRPNPCRITPNSSQKRIQLRKETYMFSKSLSRFLQTFGRGGCSLVAGLALLNLFLVVHPAHAAQLSLTWSDASTNEDGFHVQRKAGTTGTYTTIATPAPGTTGYVDGTVTAGTNYCYRVSAYNTAGDSAYSNEACATPVSATLYTVTVSKTGSTGSGTVTSTPAGIDCGATCSASIASGTSVVLTAAPATGSTFTSWSGCTSVVGTSCTLVVAAAKTVTATFTLNTYALTVSKAGTGTGTVTSTSPDTRINCGSTCSASYNHNTSVTLNATATTGSTFTGWSGACTGTGTCTVTMNGAQGVTATFAVPSPPSTYSLSVTKNGAGAGILASNPAGINCGSTCSASFSTGTVVTLQVIPESGSTFTGWSGACSGTGTCMLTMNQAQNVSATLALQSFTLTTTKAGTGAGAVASSPGGIDCGASCSATFSSGTNVTLTATPATGSTFTAWSGACSGTGTCTVTISQNRTVTATFATQAPGYILTIRKQGHGSGTVASNPAGISCGTTCRATFSSGTNVTLTATPATGSTFTGWSGACSGTGTCTVTVTQAKSVTATFKRLRR
jgi:hypothetical protein